MNGAVFVQDPGNNGDKPTENDTECQGV